MTPPEVHYVPPVTNALGYVTEPARWFVSRYGWGRRFTTREAALAHADTLWEQ